MKFSKTVFGLGLTASLAFPLLAQDADAPTEAQDTVVEAVAEAEAVAEDAAEGTIAAAETAVAEDIADGAIAAAETEATAVEEVPPVCELHVFPTLEGQAQTTTLLSGFGVIGAVADATGNEDENVSDAEYLRDALSPRFQVAAFQTIDLPASLGMPEGTEVIFETPIADRDITTEVRSRLTESTHECYAELIVTQNLYLKRAIYGRSLNNRFIFKDFRDGVEEARMQRGRGGNGLSHFPPETPEERDAADADLREAFLENFDEYSRRFRR